MRVTCVVCVVCVVCCLLCVFVRVCVGEGRAGQVGRGEVDFQQQNTGKI